MYIYTYICTGKLMVRLIPKEVPVAAAVDPKPSSPTTHTHTPLTAAHTLHTPVATTSSLEPPTKSQVMCVCVRLYMCVCVSMCLYGGMRERERERERGRERVRERE